MGPVDTVTAWKALVFCVNTKPHFLSNKTEWAVQEDAVVMNADDTTVNQHHDPNIMLSSQHKRTIFNQNYTK